MQKSSALLGTGTGRAFATTFFLTTGMHAANPITPITAIITISTTSVSPIIPLAASISAMRMPAGLATVRTKVKKRVRTALYAAKIHFLPKGSVYSNLPSPCVIFLGRQTGRSITPKPMRKPVKYSRATMNPAQGMPAG